MIVGMLAMVLDHKKPTATELMLFFVTLAGSLYSWRHTPFFALVNAPSISRHLLGCFSGTVYQRRLSGQVPEPKLTGTAHAFPAALVTAALAMTVFWSGLLFAQNETAVRNVYPERAVDYLQQRGLGHKHLFNEYDWGGYLIWRGVPVFIDGRAGTLYDEEFVRRYASVFFAAPPWRTVLDAYHVDGLLLKRSGLLASVLSSTAGWKEVYNDDLSVIYMRV